ncbi:MULTISPECIES: type VI secretion system tip protein TssI/VgrG [unclassified Pseudomonas]|uniref:type VI secretion system tip protein TssI/VgrG n=1 Tax=unclassified Pseudomonas TaxID=196821 RepID=UPI001B32C4E3|nr:MULTISPECIES: type VI secretion system tip protein TssI/VgrG [unclassified Pseudomonas]MBP5943920.1 type VI secretion system tip protein VgrG [Pseudomonas sp. P9(2020)]MBZ9563051.1 type VI secretion system tip protein VgrG [Pseudomonas sp. P116]
MFSAGNCALFTLLIPAIRHDFKVLAFNGTEAISQLYSVRIELVSEHPDFDLESLLSQPAFLQFGLDGEGIHGRIEDVMVAESGKRLTRYELTLVPALHYLQFSQDQRIFQSLTVPQIIAEVLNGHGIQADAFTFHVSTCEPREYCVQYAENNLEFIQRLCAEDGIAWHHQHSADSHMLVFTDDQVFLPKLGATPYQQDSGMVAAHPVVSRLSLRTSTRTSAVTRRDYDSKRPNLLLESRFTAEFTPTLEDYRYPLLLNNEKRAKKRVRQTLERLRADYELAEGVSDQPSLRCGYLFDLTEHPRKQCNDLWLLLSVSHTGRQPQVLEEAGTSDVKPADGFTQGYRNRFSAIPAEVVFRPPLPVRRPPLVAQTARVTGPQGEEIYCDESGRVKIELPWDRAELNSERSSCWVRVATGWAGDHFGAMAIPRIGMEVVVTFLEGDPDKPLITGCVANTVTSPPYSLPEHKTRTVLRSHSSPNSGGYNELAIEDRAGQELIYLRAQRDMVQEVGNSIQLEVGNERRETINGNSHTSVGKILDVEAGQQVHLKAGANVVLDAGASITLKAGGHHIVIDAGGIFSSIEIETGRQPADSAGSHLLLPGLEGALPVSASAPTQALIEEELEEEEEEVDLEDETPGGITLRIGVFFDGTGNNRLNSEMAAGCYASDVGLAEQAEEIQKFCMSQGYDGMGGVPDNSYGNDMSNVARLYDLYRDDSERRLESDELIGFIPVYVEGIGTSSGAEDSKYSKATGGGAQGILARVAQSPTLIVERLRLFHQKNAERKAARIELDIFGFSRGAAAARHFANEVLKIEENILVEALASTPLLVEGFSPDNLAINFIGIFDTASAVAKISSGDFSVHDAENPDVNLYLAPDIAKKVVHLVARDERRHNFSLNKADAADLVLPGVHSDLGGGYVPRITERVLLSKPRQSAEDVRLPNHESDAYKVTQYELRRLQDQLNLQDLPLHIRAWEKVFTRNAKGDRARWKQVHAVISCEREVRNDLSLIYLRVMRELGAKHGVQFKVIDEEDSRYALPRELHTIARKLMAYSLGHSGHIGLTPNEEALLLARYIHLSANWNTTEELNGSELNILFINRPAENFVRVVHPNA